MYLVLGQEISPGSDFTAVSVDVLLCINMVHSCALLKMSALLWWGASITRSDAQVLKKNVFLLPAGLDFCGEGSPTLLPSSVDGISQPAPSELLQDAAVRILLLWMVVSLVLSTLCSLRIAAGIAVFCGEG